MSETTESNTAITLGPQSAAFQKPANWERIQQLPCEIALDIPVPEFTVAALLRLSPNDVINTHWVQGSDVPLRINGKVIGWTEFEVIDDRLAVRLTQIA